MTVSTQIQVSCIVPAYNEGARIGAVLSVLTSHPMIDEIVVVDDCSSDDTSAVAESFDKMRVIRLERNGGKTRAVWVGLRNVTSEFLLLVDADLFGLDAAALAELLQPVLDGRAEMSISLRRNAPRLWHILGIDYISGERAMRRSLLANRLAEMADLPGFGFEVWLNGLIVAASGRIAVVPWPRVESPAKALKMGLGKGFLADFRMIFDMVHTTSPLRILLQIVAMQRLRIR